MSIMGHVDLKAQAVRALAFAINLQKVACFNMAAPRCSLLTLFCLKLMIQDPNPALISDQCGLRESLLANVYTSPPVTVKCSLSQLYQPHLATQLLSILPETCPHPQPTAAFHFPRLKKGKLRLPQPSFQRDCNKSLFDHNHTSDFMHRHG